jgi:hypothetical protein
MKGVNMLAIMSAFFAAYHGKDFFDNIGRNESDLIVASVNMIEVFEELYMSIISLGQRADPAHLIRNAIGFPRLMHRYLNAFKTWNISSPAAVKTVNVPKQICTIKYLIADLDMEEDALDVAHPKYASRREKLQKHQQKARHKLITMGGETDLITIDKCRMQHKLMQLHHSRHLTDLVAHRHAPAPNHMADVVAERRYIDACVLDGRLSLTNTRRWLHLTINNTLSYEYTDKADARKNKRVLHDIIQEKHTNDVSPIVNLGIAMLVCAGSLPAVKDIPETLIFDMRVIRDMHRSFHLQLVVVSTVRVILALSFVYEAEKTCCLFRTIDDIATKIMNRGLMSQDIETIVEITYAGLHSWCPEASQFREEITTSLSSVFSCKHDPELTFAAKTLRDVLHDAANYNDEFYSLDTAVEQFKKMNIPLEARCIAKLLHEQGYMVHHMLKLHIAVHFSRYIDFIRDASIAVLFSYP